MIRLSAFGRESFFMLSSGHGSHIYVRQIRDEKVRNIKKYLLAALFNAPTTISGYYQALVNHDMPQFAKAK